jgi:energy-coupling factor transport system ATP-binding protein
MRTPILVLDEPTTGQDARGVARVREVVARAAGEGRTLIAISHDMRFVAESFRRVVVMREGRVVLDGAPDVVFAETAWGDLRASYLEPPLPAVAGARLGLGSTPTDSAFVAALAAGGAPRAGRGVRRGRGRGGGRGQLADRGPGSGGGRGPLADRGQ